MEEYGFDGWLVAIPENFVGKGLHSATGQPWQTRNFHVCCYEMTEGEVWLQKPPAGGGMRGKMNIYDYWTAVHKKDMDGLRDCFLSNARICNHNTKEQLTVEEFLDAVSRDTMQWEGEVERLEEIGSLAVMVVCIRMKDGGSFHAVSFLHFMHEKIASIDRYTGPDNG